MNNEWYDWTLSNVTRKDEFTSQMPEFDYNKCMNIAKEGDLKQFRLLCNMLDIATYDRSYFNDNYRLIDNLRKACNNRVNAILGPDITQLYNELLKSQGHEQWLGDERYKLFGYNYISMCIPRYVIISIVYIIHYTHMSNSIKSAINIGKIYNCLPDNNLYYEKYLYKDPAKFCFKDSDRKNHIDRWIKFTNLIWDHDYSSAYDMIEEYNNMKNV